MNAPSHGRKISTSDQPTLAQPLRVRSLNMSKTQRNQMKMAVIQTKIQNVHRTMSQKFPEKSMVTPFQMMWSSASQHRHVRTSPVPGYPGAKCEVSWPEGPQL